MRIVFPNYRKDEVLATFNKIVTKSGMTGASIVVDDTVVEEFHPYENNKDIVILFISAEIEIPECNGWRTIAKLEATPNGNIIRSFDFNEKVPQEYWHGTNCDHCNIDRYRKESFLLLKDGVYKQVGSTCLDEFTGNAFNHVFYKGLRTLQEDCDDWKSGGGGGWEHSYSLAGLLNVAESVISVYGWTPASAVYQSGNGTSTKSHVWMYLNPSRDRPRDAKIVVPENPSDNVKASIDWIRSLPESERNNEYMHNLYMACSLEYVSDKNMGLVVSLIAAYGRMQAKRQEKEPKKESNHVGTIGQRSSFQLTLTKINSFDSAFGTKFYYIFADTSGNVFKWGTSSYLDMDVGDHVLLKGTIKTHGEFAGTKQTEITRCKVEAMVKAALY